ncbi:MAG: hypothetical protein EI684_08415 [Candidatus Viridilinea halotolerans]|uniref:Uncharacterized protein n=1 Tax=Candidatus Viridilinea halotolerans TaxID=2491704 RepID=A0A426U2B3_9CHLR|nr:MAG: hypothetical protein EI684_08415 [Candidatus Viridilinea halotolerans]
MSQDDEFEHEYRLSDLLLLGAALQSLEDACCGTRLGINNESNKDLLFHLDELCSQMENRILTSY